MNFLSLIFRYKEKKSPDRLGAYPKNVHVQAFPERRYLWSARLLVILAAMNISFTIMMASTLFLLIPSRGVTPRLLTANQKVTELDFLSPQIMNVGFGNLLTEKLIVEYVKLRHEIEFASSDLLGRWKSGTKFYWYSGSENFSLFSSTMSDTKIISLIRQDIRRFVDVKSVKRINYGLWMVDFATKTSDRFSPEVKEENWRAYLKVRFIMNNRKKKEAEAEWQANNYLINPFGFKVDNYSLGYLGENKKPTSILQKAHEISQLSDN